MELCGRSKFLTHLEQQESNNSLLYEYLSYKGTSKQYFSEFKTLILVCSMYSTFSTNCDLYLPTFKLHMQLQFPLCNIMAWRWPTCGFKHISIHSKDLVVILTNSCVNSNCVSVCNSDTKGCLRYFPSFSRRIWYNCEWLHIIWTTVSYSSMTT